MSLGEPIPLGSPYPIANYHNAMVSYLAVVQSTQNQSITTYTNLRFTGSCVFKGVCFFIAEEGGLFKYGGDLDYDAIEPVKASIKTDRSNKASGQNGEYPTQHRKRIPTSKVYLNMVATGDASLGMGINDDDPIVYPIDYQKDGLEVYPVKVGRGIDYNSLQITVDGFDVLESIEYEPEEIRRRGK